MALHCKKSNRKHFTVGAQSIARVCQNLVNCRSNISAYRRRRKLRFFLFERFWAGEWFKVITNVKIHKIFLPESHLNWQIKNVHFLGGKAYKMFKKDKFDKKNWRDSSLGHNKLTLRSNSFLACHLKFTCCFKVSHFYT